MWSDYLWDYLWGPWARMGGHGRHLELTTGRCSRPLSSICHCSAYSMQIPL